MGIGVLLELPLPPLRIFSQTGYQNQLSCCHSEIPFSDSGFPRVESDLPLSQESGTARQSVGRKRHGHTAQTIPIPPPPP